MTNVGGGCKERAQEGMHGMMGRDRRGRRLQRDTAGDKAWPGKRPLLPGEQGSGLPRKAWEAETRKLPPRNPKSSWGICSCGQKERAAGLCLAHRDTRVPGEVGDADRQPWKGREAVVGVGNVLLLLPDWFFSLSFS